MFGNITGTPLAPLSSLRELHIYDTIYDCDSIGNLFIGLHRLQHLDIRVGGSCPEIKFCSAYEEDRYSLSSRHVHSRVLPLTHLEFYQSTNSTSLPAFEILHNLTNIALTHINDLHGAIAALNSLDSPLKTLSLTTTAYNRVFNFSSTTFASWGNWKSSLEELTLNIYNLKGNELLVEGAPFQWFLKLNRLLENRIACDCF